jgi:hypothetical protein
MQTSRDGRKCEFEGDTYWNMPVYGLLLSFFLATISCSYITSPLINAEFLFPAFGEWWRKPT